ncbi:hypothetical protein LguiA_029746 [Lonicera macranthoides]
MASMSSPPTTHLHFVLVPLLAQGHMLPMIDMAKLLAQHGVIVSLVTTPHNASRFSTIIDRERETGLQIELITIPFPWQEVGLPPDCENLDSVPSRDLLRNFYSALNRLQKPLEQHLQEKKPPPSCIISDKCLFWTSQTARKFNVPRLVFHGMCCFSLLCSHNIKLHNSHMSVESYFRHFLVPGLAQKVEITRAQLPELENGFVEDYKMAIQKKVYCIGPVSLCNKGVFDKFERGNKSSINREKCIKWLDSMSPTSVLYACLGSQCRLVPSQLIELGLGLKASNKPFIWVIKSGERFEELEEWLMKENFEERITGRGLLIKEQFFNEKLIVEILRVGVRVGVEVSVRWGDEEKAGVLVKKDEVERAIERVINGGEEMRERAREIGLMASKAMEKGGSSWFNNELLINDIMKHYSQGKIN